MIVCATPRSGGTVFGFDKAKELGVVFLNEVVPGNTLPFQFRPTWKNKYHELPSQPILSMQELHNVSSNPSDEGFVVLVNGSNSHWLFHQAHWFVARRNIKEWMYSVCNFWIKNRNGKMGLELIQTYLVFMIENGYALYDFCTQYDKNITWYEDVYYKKNEYVHLHSHPDKWQILSTIEKLVEQTKILDTHKELVYN
jgi:hypothetical protein